MFAMLLTLIAAKRPLPGTRKAKQAKMRKKEIADQPELVDLPEEEPIEEEVVETIIDQGVEPPAEPVAPNATDADIKAQAQQTIKPAEGGVPASPEPEDVEIKQQPAKPQIAAPELKKPPKQTAKSPLNDIVQLHFNFLDDLCTLAVDRAVPIYKQIQANKLYSYVFLSLLYVILLHKIVGGVLGLFKRRKPQAVDSTAAVVQSQIADLKKHIDDRLETLKTFDTEFLKEERKQTEEFMDFFEKNVTDVWKEIGQIKEKLNENEVNTLSNTNSFANELKQTMDGEFDKQENTNRQKEPVNATKEAKADDSEGKSPVLLKPKPKPLPSKQEISPEKPKIGRPVLPKKLPKPKAPAPVAPKPENQEPVEQAVDQQEEDLQNEPKREEPPFKEEYAQHDELHPDGVMQPTEAVEEPETDIFKDIDEIKEADDRIKEKPVAINPFSLNKPKEPEVSDETKPAEPKVAEDIKPVLPKFKPPSKPGIGKFKRPAIPLVKPLPNTDNK